MGYVKYSITGHDACNFVSPNFVYIKVYTLDNQENVELCITNDIYW